MIYAKFRAKPYTHLSFSWKFWSSGETTVAGAVVFFVRKKKTHDAPSNLQIVFWALDLYIKTRPLILSFEHERWIVFETDLAYWNWRSTVNSISFEAQDYCLFGFESWPSDWSGRTRSEVCNRTPLLHTTLEYFWADFRFFVDWTWTGLSGPDLLSAPLPLLSAPPQLKLILIDFQLIFKST
jgi:hypothetical protein